MNNLLIILILVGFAGVMTITDFSDLPVKLKMVISILCGAVIGALSCWVALKPKIDELKEKRVRK